MEVAQAQKFSNWIADSKRPNLKVRWVITKQSDNYTYLLVQLQNDKEGCKMIITSSVCNKDATDKNGWKSIKLMIKKPSTYTFKILNSCTNGFWWWYKDYVFTAVKYDDL